uniref:Uncharacterized protein n=1 Tax=Siphoviridae sp. ctM3g2 TaxID=2826255 RepID=A0A8S5LUI0_9CAUD|nr:MAG TPA: hypothetical protein [Siphoviridae sp. ctM3g2]
MLALLVRPSRMTLDAMEATLGLVCFLFKYFHHLLTIRL